MSRKSRFFPVLALGLLIEIVIIFALLAPIDVSGDGAAPVPTLAQLTVSEAVDRSPESVAIDVERADANGTDMERADSVQGAESADREVVAQPALSSQPADSLATPPPQPTLVPTNRPFPSPTPRSQVQPIPPPAAPPQQPIANQIIITFAPEASSQARDAYIAQLGGEVIQSIDALNSVVVEVPADVVPEPLPQSAIVALAEPDYQVVAQLDIPPNDPLYAQQWALPAIGAPDAWLALPADAPTVAVAVIDSGVCASHPDLQGRILPGWDYVENDSAPQDAFGHGCGVAGIIAANVDDGIGMAGVAPNAMVLPLRVLNASGVGAYSDVAAAIVRATDEGAQVINLSLGGAFPSTVMESAVNYAVESGVTVVAAAGNTGSEQVLYPAAYAPVIAVGAVDEARQTASFSARGAGVDIWAPGQSILTTRLDGTHAPGSGTSFAAPYVAGAAAVQSARGQQLAMGGMLGMGGGAGGDGGNGETPEPTQVVAVPTATAGITAIESIDFDSIIQVPHDIRASIATAITQQSGSLTSNSYHASAFSISDDGLWARIVFAPDYVIDSGWELVHLEDLVEIIARRENMDTAWTSAIYTELDFEALNNQVPPDFIDFSAAMTPQATQYQFQ